MNGNWGNRGRVALVLAGLLAAPVQAQEMDRPGGPRPVPPVMEELDRMVGPERGPDGGPGGEEEGGRRHFETKKRERLMQALQLDEATRARLSQRLEQLDQKGEDLRRQRQDALRALRDQAQSLRKDQRRGPRGGDGRGPEAPPAAGGHALDSSTLKQALERIYAVEEAMTSLRRERLQAARDLLTPEQQLKFLIFNIRFQKEMRDRLQQEQGGPGSGPMDMKRRFESGGDGGKR